MRTIAKGLVLISLLVFLTSCKNTTPVNSTPNEVKEVLMLLSAGSTPSTVEALASYEVVAQKRSSRSQNLWLVKINSINTHEEISRALKEDTSVLKVYPKQKDSNSNSTNNKKGTSTPKN